MEARRTQLVGSPRHSPPSLRPHAFMFFVCALPWVFGPLLTVSTTAATMFGVHAPACVAHVVLPGAGCPGCGLTRSVALALQGEVGASLALNPAGILILVLALGGLLVHGDVLRRGIATGTHKRLLCVGYIVFCAGVLATWLVRLLF